MGNVLLVTVNNVSSQLRACVRTARALYSPQGSGFGTGSKERAVRSDAPVFVGDRHSSLLMRSYQKFVVVGGGGSVFARPGSYMIPRTVTC